VLIFAIAVSFGIGSYFEGGIVAAVILLNIVVGFFQEYSAENSTFDDKTSPSDRLNVAYSSSTCTKGRAKGIMFATARQSELRPHLNFA